MDCKRIETYQIALTDDEHTKLDTIMGLNLDDTPELREDVLEEIANTLQGDTVIDWWCDESEDYEDLDVSPTLTKLNNMIANTPEGSAIQYITEDDE